MAFADRAGLSVAAPLVRFLEEEALPGSGLDAAAFWPRVAAIFERFVPENRALLAERDRLQAAIDERYRSGQPADAAFLRAIGYLVPEPAPFAITTSGIDPEVATIAGPQLVVPVLNARFLLNAANARWGSLYDALYGTDAIPGAIPAGGYDADRGTAVIDRARHFLDDAVPLADGRWADWTGGTPTLADPAALIAIEAGSILLRHNGLHIEIVIDRTHPIGAADPAGIADVRLEAAVTTICDFEDSIAAVDAADKVAAYANWLRLMQGTLEATFEKNGAPLIRRLAPDRRWHGIDGEAVVLPGRSLLFVRNVGHLMTTPSIRLPDGGEAPEGILDAIVTSLCALHDGTGPVRNSATGAIYIVKPKMHGPDEAAFADRLFDAVEDLLGLARHTIRIGVMDEERRTSANLAAVIGAVRHRVMFVNTGFLDRTGDEIHTAMEAGAMLPKAAIRTAPWIGAYEDRNVRIGLAAGFAGRAQIGKGMWAAPDRMADMLAQKIGHPRAGATTAWVPSPTAAVLHATHYHLIDVAAVQASLRAESAPALDVLLTPPLAEPGRNWQPQEIAAELDNNAQGILGYVVRWIDQGIGCSKVPDIHDIGLMEDRATLRISSQHIANWLRHGVCTQAEVEAALRRMAARVDAQNAGDPAYRPMTGNEDGSHAWKAALALVFEGAGQPNGYTEPLLHAFRAAAKAEN